MVELGWTTADKCSEFVIRGSLPGSLCAVCTNSAVCRERLFVVGGECELVLADFS